MLCGAAYSVRPIIDRPRHNVADFAFLAHSEAYKIGVIHRDISAGNVLLYYDPKTDEQCGLLNDWELSKKTDSVRPCGRQLDRTVSSFSFWRGTMCSRQCRARGSSCPP